MDHHVEARIGDCGESQCQHRATQRNADVAHEFVVTAATPAPAPRDPGLCVRGPCDACARRVSVHVPLHGLAERAARPTARNCWGATVPWLGAWPRRGCSSAMSIGPAARRGMWVCSAEADREADTGVATGG